MSRRNAGPLFPLVESFFREHLGRIRNASQHTVLAYADSLRLFFSFVADACGADVADLCLDNLTVDNVLDFLDHLESNRCNGATTRNLRLTAIRSFFRYLMRHDPSHGAQYQRVLSLPHKRASSPVVTYLEPEEMHVLLRQPDRRTTTGTRDHAFLLFLYNTGARIGEATAVRRDDLQLTRPFQANLHGKGRKDRVCPIWPDTAKALRRLQTKWAPQPDGYVFHSARGKPLSRDGAAYILDKYIHLAARELPALKRKHITPHSMRHSCAVALLQAGVDLTVIRDYLGHESIATTGRYTKTNLRMKRRVLEAFWRRAGLTNTRDPKWKARPTVLTFLRSL